MILEYVHVKYLNQIFMIAFGENHRISNVKYEIFCGENHRIFQAYCHVQTTAKSFNFRLEHIFSVQL
jgi:hypothetical protein